MHLVVSVQSEDVLESLYPWQFTHCRCSISCMLCIDLSKGKSLANVANTNSGMLSPSYRFQVTQLVIDAQVFQYCRFKFR